MHNWVEIDLSAIRRNFLVIKGMVSDKVSIMPVVKNDAYGHGLLPISLELAKLKPEAFAVSKCWEAVALRKAFIDTPIVVLSGLQDDEYDEALSLNIRPVIFNLDHLYKCDRSGARFKTLFPVHIKIDTGMGRLGFTSKEYPQLIRALNTYKNIYLEGVMSHFADGDAESPSYTLKQIQSLVSFIDLLKTETGLIPLRVHIANSAGIIRFPQSRFNMIRPGLILYGPASFARNQFLPAMTFKARILQVKDVPPFTPIGYGCSFITTESMKIATVSAGYGDGYPRSMSNKGEVLIKGKRCKIVGRVSMNLITVNVSELNCPVPGEEVVLLGSQGHEIIKADEIATISETINYEIYCRIGTNPLKRYIDTSQETEKGEGR